MDSHSILTVEENKIDGGCVHRLVLSMLVMLCLLLTLSCPAAAESPAEDMGGQVDSAATAVEERSVLNNDRVKREESLLRERLHIHREAIEQQYALLPYRENYVVASYMFNGVNQQPFEEAFPDEAFHYRDYELQFQLSFLVPLMVDILDSSVTLYGAYTNRSFWQILDTEDSRPFRETNHEPEIWLSYFYDLHWGGLKAPMIWFGYSHQSNGQYVSLSRGWNRLYVQAFFDYRRWSYSVKVWNKLPGGSEEDNRFDYEKFIGQGELDINYAFTRNDMGLRYSFSADGLEYGSVTADFTVPFSPSLSFYMRYFYGYGESLIDVDYKSNTLSIGFKVNQW